MNSTYEIIKDAIVNKKVVTAIYEGHRRKMCPHTLGTKNGRPQALFYQFGGTSSSGLAPIGSPQNWRCIQLDKLHDVSSESGPWHSASNHSRRQTCVDRVDVEVDY